MRFTIRQLLLLPPAFLLNAGIVWLFVFPPLHTPSWAHEANRIRRTQLWVETFFRSCKHDNILLSDCEIHDWMCHRLSPNHPAAKVWLDPPGLELDVWGNPYRIQLRSSIFEKPRVYSTGEDGLSISDGNDPDDIRSWDEQPWRWYSRQQLTRRTTLCMVASAFITAAGFWLVILKNKTALTVPQSRT